MKFTLIRFEMTLPIAGFSAVNAQSLVRRIRLTAISKERTLSTIYFRQNKNR